MPEELREGRELDRLWNDLVADQGDERGYALAPATTETLRTFQAMAKTPPPQASRERVDRDVFAAVKRAAREHRPLAPSGELVVLAAPDHALAANGSSQPVSPQATANRQRPRWGAAIVAEFATAALVLLTLVGSFVAFGGPLRQQGEVEPPASVPAPVSAPETSLPTGVTEDTVVIQQQIDELPPKVEWVGVERISADPGVTWSLGTAETMGVGPMVYRVESGIATVRADGPFAVTRSGEAAATEGVVGADVVLHTGDIVFLPSGVSSQWRNDGTEPATTLEAGFVWGGMPIRTPGVSYHFPIDSSPARTPALPAYMTVRRIALAPGASLPNAQAPGLKLLGVESGALDVVWTKAAEGLTPAAPAGSSQIAAGSWRDVNNAAVFASEFRNTGTEPVVFLLMTVTPIDADAAPSG